MNVVYGMNAMATVFVAGSRAISKLDTAIEERLDNIVRRTSDSYEFKVGDSSRDIRLHGRWAALPEGIEVDLCARQNSIWIEVQYVHACMPRVMVPVAPEASY